VKSGFIAKALILCLAVPLWLGGCSVASMVGNNSEPPPAIQDLQAEGASGLGHLPLQLVIHEPACIDALAGSRIAIKPSASEISYFAAAAWTDKLPRLLKMRLVQSFERSRVVKAVSGGDDRLRGDVGLSWEIRDFQIEVSGGAAQANASAYVKVIDEDAGRLVSAQAFNATAPARNDSVEAGVEALQQAYNQLAVKIMRWVASRRIVVVDASSAAAEPASPAAAAGRPAN
jgi:cholesterol transport system auxiliary component